VGSPNIRWKRIYTKNDDDDYDTVWDRPVAGALRMIKNVVIIIKIL
jgi:hypothetical protein